MKYSLYLHIPFCLHRCGYCDFNTYAGLEDLIPAYTGALVREIAQVAECAGAHQPGRLPVHTIFFGGGTPSLLPVPALERILGALRAGFNLDRRIGDPPVEITLEANPGTLSAEYLHALHGLGVNRLSLGVQSANPGELRLLERQHDFPDVIRSVAWARQAGFDNLSLDLIFGLPEQSLANWQHSLDLALDLQPEHISLYALTIEHGTPFGRWARRGLLSAPDPDLAAEMYEWAAERLERKSYTQYEISNWARANQPAGHQTLSPTLRAANGPAGNPALAEDVASPALACRHNLQYWHNLPYLGLGAGAHGYAAGRRTINTLSPQAYIQRLPDPGVQAPPATLAGTAAPASAARPPFPITAATQSSQPIDRAAEIGETMMMGLRLVREGVSEAVFQARFGQSLREVFPKEIERLQRQGLLEWAGPDGDRLRLTRRARLVANRVFVEFI